MARKQAPTFKTVLPEQTWLIPKKGLDGEWYGAYQEDNRVGSRSN